MGKLFLFGEFFGSIFNVTRVGGGGGGGGIVKNAL